MTLGAVLRTASIGKIRRDSVRSAAQGVDGVGRRSFLMFEISYEGFCQRIRIRAQALVSYLRCSAALIALP
jgi:hypothetical protein